MFADKKKVKKIICLIVGAGLVLTGCQKTPDKSAVVSKEDGLSKDVIAEPLKDGEKRTTDIPEHWKLDEKKSNDRVTISADLELGKIEIGNLPVIEMKNHKLSQKELEKLVDYFSEGADLYLPKMSTKEFYQNLIERIENKEGAYGEPLMGDLSSITTVLQQCVELAPNEDASAEKAEISFKEKADDPAYQTYESTWVGEQEQQQGNKEVYFSADVDENRTAHIQAETYDSSVGNRSSFSWKKGAEIITASDVESTKKINDFSRDEGGGENRLFGERSRNFKPI